MPQDHSNDKSTLLLGAVRQQAITWANVDTDFCHLMAPINSLLNWFLTFKRLSRLDPFIKLSTTFADHFPAGCLGNLENILRLHRHGIHQWNWGKKAHARKIPQVDGMAGFDGSIRVQLNSVDRKKNDVMRWNQFLHFWPFVGGFHRSYR